MHLIRRTLIVGTLACLFGVPAQYGSASPWLEVGDSYARFKLQQAADRKQLQATVTSWPLARSNARLSDDRSHNLPWNELAEPIGSSASVFLRGSSDSRFVRGFEGGVRDEAEVGANLSYVGDRVAVRLSPSYVNDPLDTEDLRFDGSYLAATQFNWTVGAGYMDRWWGPGWQSSLILSNNARPIPSIWLERRNTQVTDNWLMSWMGPWQFTGFAGQMEKERYVPDAKLIGMRLNFRPFSSRLEIGLSRLIQWSGEGQPSNWDSFWDALIGKDNGQQDRDPSNQLGGIDLRYGFAWGERTIGLYTQVIGDDEANHLPSRKVYQFGADWTSALWSGEQQWFIEATDTMTEGVIGSDKRPNYAYEHFNYRSGMRYLGRNIAPTIDADGRALTVGFHHFLASHNKWSVVLTHAELNRDGGNRFDNGKRQAISYAVPLSAQKVTVLDLSHTRSLLGGDGRLYLTLSSDSIELADETLPRAIAGVEWSFNFL